MTLLENKVLKLLMKILILASGKCVVIVIWLSLDITVDTFVVLKLNYQM